MTTKKPTKLLALYLPYLLLGLIATNFGEAWRLAEGKELGDKIMSMMGKKAAYPGYRKARNEMQELVRAQKNVERFFAEEKDTIEKTQTR